MKKIVAAATAVMFIFAVASVDAAMKSKKAKKGIKDMTREELIQTALGGAPRHISKDAAVMIPGADGKLVEAKKGTNGFTCMPDISGQEEPDPICGDKSAFTWLTDAMSKAPKPTNTEPGIAYMGKGGWHWEKGGKIVDATTPGATRVKEPPHWMVLWPFGAKPSMLPSMGGGFGTYIMYEGTPYAHLMIYQDPGKLGGK